LSSFPLTSSLRAVTFNGVRAFFGEKKFSRLKLRLTTICNVHGVVEAYFFVAILMTWNRAAVGIGQSEKDKTNAEYGIFPLLSGMRDNVGAG
jgi:hypothetical protein